MKIKLNDTTRDYSAREVASLKQKGYRFYFSIKMGVYVPAQIQIHENGEVRDTDVSELVRRRARGEKFLKVKGRPVYALTDADTYSAIMRPIWSEDKKEARRLHCIYEGKACCNGRDCDNCTQPVYRMKSLERAMEINDLELHDAEACDGADAAEIMIGKERNNELYRAIEELDDVDLKILLLTAAGKSERDIAEALGFRSKESIRKRKKKFLPRLQKQLEKFL
ncbi:MAG: sigma-70 family RNA polymerase sigma factor [Selenomonas sp.]|nr:sigma-70 family RNA polymerase sigma factor [Selenomonas sp.]